MINEWIDHTKLVFYFVQLKFLKFYFVLLFCLINYFVLLKCYLKLFLILYFSTALIFSSWNIFQLKLKKKTYEIQSELDNKSNLKVKIKNITWKSKRRCQPCLLLKIILMYLNLYVVAFILYSWGEKKKSLTRYYI